jgi:quercetin dioxygenase-like cupin family protein
MKLTQMPEAVTDWTRTSMVTIAGASGAAQVRARQIGAVQLRVVEYSADYLADHWCSKGHIIYVISGALAIEHEDGTSAHLLQAGVSWHVADGATPAHRVRSETGARVFIVD